MTKLIVDQVTDQVTSITIDVNYPVNGSVRTWWNLNGTGTIALRNSFNLSSISDGGTGTYIGTFTATMSDSNYSADGTCNESGGGVDATIFQANTNGLLSTSFTERNRRWGSGITDSQAISGIIRGNLA